MLNLLQISVDKDTYINISKRHMQKEQTVVWRISYGFSFGKLSNVWSGQELDGKPSNFYRRISLHRRRKICACLTRTTEADSIRL